MRGSVSPPTELPTYYTLRGLRILVFTNDDYRGSDDAISLGLDVLG